MVRGATTARENGGLARAFVIRFNGAPFGLFRILDGSKASTNLVDQPRRPASSTPRNVHPRCSTSLVFSPAHSSLPFSRPLSLAPPLRRERCERRGPSASGRAFSVARAETFAGWPLVRWHVKFASESLIITRRATALSRATKRIDLFYKLG